MLLDRLLYRTPFEGGNARRYVRDARPAFGDLDQRLLDQLAPAGVLLDLGSGPGTFAAAARARGLTVIAIEPSAAFAPTVRARGEQLPLADRSIDLAICLSSIRHVQDRARTLRELRRVVRDRLVIVELDPTASRARIANHARGLRSRVLRVAFGPLVCRTAPTAETISRLAAHAGWRQTALRADPVQPVYILELC